MTKILTAAVAALALTTASMAMTTDASAKNGFKNGKYHHGHRHVRHGKIYVTFDDDSDCKWHWTRKRGWFKVCDDDDD